MSGRFGSMTGQLNRVLWSDVLVSARRPGLDLRHSGIWVGAEAGEDPSNATECVGPFDRALGQVEQLARGEIRVGAKEKRLAVKRSRIDLANAGRDTVDSSCRLIAAELPFVPVPVF